MTENGVVDLENQLAEGDWWEIWEFFLDEWILRGGHYSTRDEADKMLKAAASINKKHAVIVRVRRTAYKQPQAPSGGKEE